MFFLPARSQFCLWLAIILSKFKCERKLSLFDSIFDYMRCLNVCTLKSCLLYFGSCLLFSENHCFLMLVLPFMWREFLKPEVVSALRQILNLIYCYYYYLVASKISFPPLCTYAIKLRILIYSTSLTF